MRSGPMLVFDAETRIIFDTQMHRSFLELFTADSSKSSSIIMFSYPISYSVTKFHVSLAYQLWKEDNIFYRANSQHFKTLYMQDFSVII